MTRAEELRAEFDAGFAAPRPAPPAPHVDVLQFSLGALRLADISSLHVDLAIVPLPTRSRALLGVAMVRAVLVPIFDTGVLAGGAAMVKPRYVAIANGLGFAFDGFHGHVRVREVRDPIDLAALAAAARES